MQGSIGVVINGEFGCAHVCTVQLLDHDDKPGSYPYGHPLTRLPN